MQPLEPLSIPLHGRRLIEASAGTGKTFTLALLFLRLLIEQQIPVNHILVVTFTRAATGELRDRIRRRLREALDALEGRAVPDPLLAELLSQGSDHQTRQILADALVGMDEAAIYTIHGFCQRILQDHAFESGNLFAQNLLESEELLRTQIVEDYWRNRFYTATIEETTWATACWQDPHGLLQAVIPLVQTVSPNILPDLSPAALAQEAEECQQLFYQVQQAWSTHRSEIAEVLSQHSCLKRNDKAYRKHDQVPLLLAEMDHLQTLSAMPLHLSKGLARLGISTMLSHLTKKCATPPEHHFFTLFDQWYQKTSSHLAQRQAHILMEAAAYLKEELDRRKQQQGWISFDDLLTRLALALDDPATGQRLAARILERFPAALVDEFQDTDPVQYHIFSTVYRQQTASLFMIGDPKQAIYSFRGADIFTYIRARRDTPQDHRYTMATNYRSSPDMVAAVNTIFQRRHDAFVFADDITFQPVAAAAEHAGQSLQIDAQPLAPLQALLLDSELLRASRSSTISKDRATQASVKACADHLARLLDVAAEDQVVVTKNSTEQPPLKPGDIVILVRAHHEAEAMQQGLRERGLSSVYYSQSSVFSTPEAKAFAQVLHALAELANPARIRTALATPLFGRNASELYQLNQDPLAWETLLGQLNGYLRLWREQGLVPMFQQLLTDQQVTSRLSALPVGERSLTNFLHLAELLQESPASRHGMAAQLRWFQYQLENPDPNASSQLIRLESDEEQIKIITIHRAKGLEFPVVVLPFLWYGRILKGQAVSFHDRTNLEATIDLNGEDLQHREYAAEEQLAEDLRILYVALTRAKYCCLFCWGRVRELEHTGLAYLLHQGATPPDDIALREDLEQLNQEQPIIELLPSEAIPSWHYRPASLTKEAVTLRRFRGTIPTGWSMTSYSRLTAAQDHHEQMDLDAQDSPSPPAPEDFISRFTFPRGPSAGTCLHSILELVDFTRPAQQHCEQIAPLLDQAGINEQWVPATLAWIDDILAVPLPGSCALNQVSARDRINELNFLFPMEGVSLPTINVILHRQGLLPINTAPGALQGLMKGFIDLIFRYEDKYYIVDYKSNYLGPDLDSYCHQSIETCMRSHRYHLQYLIYSVALHRFLATRISNYSYEHHFGGVYYLFLRAMHPSYPAGSGIHTDRPELDLITELDCCFQGEVV